MRRGRAVKRARRKEKEDPGLAGHSAAAPTNEALLRRISLGLGWKRGGGEKEVKGMKEEGGKGRDF